MAYSIYLYKYNNYYNRKVKRVRKSGNVLVPADLINAGATQLYAIGNINFKYGDGVTQEIILNIDSESAANPDYCLIYKSRAEEPTLWFVMELERTRAGQTRLLLYRDLINAYYDDIVKAPCFIEKAKLSNDNILIFNNENMAFNKIKKDEIPLYDSTKMPWIVGYLSAKDSSVINGSFSLVNDKNYLQTEYSHSNWIYSNGLKYIPRSSVLYSIFSKIPIEHTEQYSHFSKWFNEAGTINDNIYEYLNPYGNNGINKKAADINPSWFNYGTLYTDIINIETAKTDSDYNDFIKFNNKVVQFSDGFYRVVITQTSNTIVKRKYVDNITSYSVDMANVINSHFTSVYTYGKPYGYEFNELTYTVTFELVEIGGSYTYTLGTGIQKLQNAPYKMFVIPYPVKSEKIVKYQNYDASVYFNLDVDLMMSWAIDIAKQADANLYDLQILPYCPISAPENGPGLHTYKNSLGEMVLLNQTLNDSLNTDYIYLYKGQNNEKCGVAFFVKNNTFSNTIGYPQYDTVEDLVNITVTDAKIQNECESYRICSPNYNGVFEINAAKNGGLNNFTCECTYKPYNPYICVHPRFNKLYGMNYNDSRGLICGGDFSIDIAKDAFVSYELQNKNYQKTFQRQIENMEVNNSIARQEAVIGAVSGTVSGAVTGAVAGGMAGGGIGAVAGGIVGGAASAVGGAVDIANMKKLQSEALDYTKDLYGYNLANIQALPYSLSKVSSLNINSKYVPFLEYYSASDVEKEALRDKIKYNGMSVGVIGKISDYLWDEESYIKARLIRLENVDIDYHEMTVIAEELNKGVFI